MSRGILELTNPEQIEKDRVRKKGGGRKTSLVTIPDIDEKFIMVIWDHFLISMCHLGKTAFLINVDENELT